MYSRSRYPHSFFSFRATSRVFVTDKYRRSHSPEGWWAGPTRWWIEGMTVALRPPWLELRDLCSKSEHCLSFRRLQPGMNLTIQSPSHLFNAPLDPEQMWVKPYDLAFGLGQIPTGILDHNLSHSSSWSRGCDAQVLSPSVRCMREFVQTQKQQLILDVDVNPQGTCWRLTFNPRTSQAIQGTTSQIRLRFRPRCT